MGERKPFMITWRIKNLSFCWQKKEEELPGPTFIIEGMEEIKWTIILFPQASGYNERGNIACYFYVEREENERKEFEIDYELSALGPDGLPLATETFTEITMRGNEWSSPLLLERNTMFCEKPDEFLPKDTLTIRCKIWPNYQENTNAERFLATTRIELEKASIFGIVRKNHDEVIPEQSYNIQFISVSTETSPIFINIRVIKGKPYAEIHPANYELMKFCKCEMYFTDSYGKEIVYGQDEFLFDFNSVSVEGNMQVWNIPLRVTNDYDYSQPHRVMENLFLRCNVTYSTGIMSEKFEKIDYSVNTFQNGCCLKEKRQNYLPSLKDDMFSLMTNEDSSDILLRTKTKTFHAHRIILSARSLFFRNKFDENKKVKIIGVEDLDNETLDQMLVFLYTDTIENLESKNAMNLYIASRRYGIPLLKHKCSCFLQNNMDAYICCDALQLADQYQDSDLKKAALNYILEHADEVIGSDKWQKLEPFSELTEEVLYFKRMDSQENKRNLLYPDEDSTSVKIDDADISSQTSKQLENLVKIQD